MDSIKSPDALVVMAGMQIVFYIIAHRMEPVSLQSPVENTMVKRRVSMAVALTISCLIECIEYLHSARYAQIR